MMKRTIIILLSVLLLPSCGQSRATVQKQGGDPASNLRTEPTEYTFRVKNTYPHQRDAYTQGLQFADGLLWEGTGQNGESRLQTIDLKSGEVKVINRLPDSEFGEGITLLGDRIFQLTWLSNKAYMYDREGRVLHHFRYPGEGWGLTTDGEKLYMSNGTEKIHIISPDKFRRERHITVTCRGEALGYLNELEWIDGRLWANIYTLDRIAIIDPHTGIVEGLVNLEGLLPAKDRTPSTDVLNGIAWDEASRRLFVTGKNWPTIFEIEIIKK